MRFTITHGPLRGAVLPLMTVAVLALAGCGSNSSGSTTARDAGQGSGQSSGKVVAVSDSGGRDVLVDSQGKALYFSDEEKAGKVLCTSGACNAIWAPLTVPGKNSLSAPRTLSSKLGTVARPDGSTQVTLDGRPLYTFSFDHSAGEVNGDGQQDSFDGTHFTWHVATPSGPMAAAHSPSSSSSSSPYGGGGYSY
jgi:predicted lipoprotein with Yx(FWY)xxD motif